MEKDSEKEIDKYFSRKINNSLNELSTEIFFEMRRVTEEASSRGMMQSGMFIVNLLDTITNNTINSCKEKLQLIDEFQEYMRITLSTDQLNNIENKFIDSYTSFFMQMVEIEYKNEISKILGDLESINMTSEAKINNSFNKIRALIIDKVEDVRVKNKLQKEEPSVRLAKNSNSIAFLALVVSIISIILGFL
ncbi:hypothetical protein NST63_08475 [Heyndrickxia sp. FSL W8-0496]|uniref:hypothetical protein n=1 Tax=Heyndrickxia TaxID=2837504 RepID=UPI0030FC0828